MTAFLAYIDNRKTYVVCAATIAYAWISFYLKMVDLNTAFQMTLAALGAAGFRSAIQKNTDAVAASPIVPVSATVVVPQV